MFWRWDWRASTGSSHPAKLRYEHNLRKHLLPFFGDRPVGTVTVLDVQTWLADRHANGRLSPNRVAKAYKVLRMVMDVAVEPASSCTLRAA